LEDIERKKGRAYERVREMTHAKKARELKREREKERQRGLLETYVKRDRKTESGDRAGENVRAKERVCVYVRGKEKKEQEARRKKEKGRRRKKNGIEREDAQADGREKID